VAQIRRQKKKPLYGGDRHSEPLYGGDQPDEPLCGGDQLN
jgi:hypothetical protein